MTNSNEPLVLTQKEKDAEVAKIANFSRRERERYNKKVDELVDSLKKLEDTESALSKISNTEPLLAEISQLIKDTRELTQDTLKNQLVNNKEQMDLLGSYYRDIDALLEKHRKDNVITNDNQIATVKQILKESEREKKEQEESTQSSQKKSSSSDQSSLSQVASGVGTVAEVSKNPAMAAMYAFAPQLAMLAQASAPMVSTVGHVTSGLLKGTYKTTKGLIGGTYDALFNKSGGVKTAEKKVEKRQEKRDKETRKQTDLLKQIAKSTEETAKESKNSWVGTAIKIGVVVAAVYGIYKLLTDWLPKLNPLNDKNMEETHQKAIESGNRIKERGWADTLTSKEGWKDLGRISWHGIKDATLNMASAMAHPIDSIMEGETHYEKEKRRKQELTGSPYGVVSKAPATTRDAAVRDYGKYIMSKGYTADQAAAILGNAAQESNFDPEALNEKDPGGSRGMFQWSPDRYANLEKYAKKYGKDPKDPYTQIDFALQEEGGKLSVENLSKVEGDAGDLAYHINKKFERSADSLNRSSEHNQKRENYAKQFASVLKQYDRADDIGSVKPQEQYLADAESREKSSRDNKVLATLDNASTAQSTSTAELAQSINNVINNQTTNNNKEVIASNNPADIALVPYNGGLI